jgi:hypothetical protein
MRFQNRMMWVQVLERGFDFATVALKVCVSVCVCVCVCVCVRVCVVRNRLL